MYFSSLSLALVGLFPYVLCADSPKNFNRAIAGGSWSRQSRYGGSRVGEHDSVVPTGYSSSQPVTTRTVNSLSTAATTPLPTTITTSTISKTATTSSTLGKSCSTSVAVSNATSKSLVKSAVSSGLDGRKVFAHYMIGSTNQAETLQDVQDAKKAGFDGFALNTNTLTAQFATDALGWLFQAADDNDFSLFISFDVSWGFFQVKEIPDFLMRYASRVSYHKVDNKPVVSTFWGGKISSDEWNNDFRQLLATKYNVTPFFIPSFDDMEGYPNGLVDKFGSVIDGAFNWESAWPAPSNDKTVVSSAMDQNIMQQLGSKPYMMPLSPLQFKYATFGKWYRAGEINLPMRMEQILQLQPQFIEVLTWNDAGESHYIGNIFPTAIAGMDDIRAYTDDFDHKGWQQVIKPFIAAFKQGATDISQILPLGSNPVGTMWYRTQLSATSCNDGNFQNHGQAEDALNFAVLLPSSGYMINVFSDNVFLESIPGKAGLNYKMVLGLRSGGDQRIEVVDASSYVAARAVGTKAVQAESSSCNWNYEVVGFSS